MVTLARGASGSNLGQRMGFMVGGAWGMGSVVLMLLGPVAERFGVEIVLRFSCGGYIISALIGIWLIFKVRRNGQTASIVSSDD